MKVQSTPNGYPARRRAIQNVKDQFYFIFKNSLKGGRPARRSLWGIVILFFVLLQACNQMSDRTMVKDESTHGVRSPDTSKKFPTDNGALLLQPVERGMHAFSAEYLNQGFKDDLYLRDWLSTYGAATPRGFSGQSAVSENTMVH